MKETKKNTPTQKHNGIKHDIPTKLNQVSREQEKFEATARGDSALRDSTKAKKNNK